jgi:hypothetical protein
MRSASAAIEEDRRCSRSRTFTSLSGLPVVAVSVAKYHDAGDAIRMPCIGRTARRSTRMVRAVASFRSTSSCSAPTATSAVDRGPIFGMSRAPRQRRCPSGGRVETCGRPRTRAFLRRTRLGMIPKFGRSRLRRSAVESASLHRRCSMKLGARSRRSALLRASRLWISPGRRVFAKNQPARGRCPQVIEARPRSANVRKGRTGNYSRASMPGRFAAYRVEGPLQELRIYLEYVASSRSAVT